jgi:CRISPR/Cas system CSM-associated protein Csm3 (group 7 of RAMP superfamily)
MQYRFFLPCRALTPLRPGRGDAGEHTDAELCSLADGTLAVRGTSIGGVLRSAVERLLWGVVKICKMNKLGWPPRGLKAVCGCVVCRLFGDCGNGEEGAPSRVTVLDAPIHTPRTRVVDGIARSHATRAVAGQRKFDWREIEVGAQVIIQVEAVDPSEEELALLGAALRLVATGRLPLGGRSAAGLGWLDASDPTACSLRRRDLSTPEHLLAAVAFDTGSEGAYPEVLAQGLDQFPGADRHLPDRLEISCELKIHEESTLLVSDPVEALRSGRDKAPRGGAKTPELPFSSIRGALRARAATVVRTIRNDSASACDPSGENRCGDPASLCALCRVFGIEDWGSRLKGYVRPLDVSRAHGVGFDRVPLDRLTQRPFNKFDEEAARKASYTLKLFLDQGPNQPPAADDMQWWVLGLLALALSDLSEGRVTVGSGGAVGHGWLNLAGSPVFTDSRGRPLSRDLEGCVRALWSELEVPFPEPGVVP